MDKKQLTLMWIQELSQSLDQNQLNDKLVTFLSENIDSNKEFKAWAKNRKTQLKASITSEALDALKAQHESEVNKQLTALGQVSD